MSRVTALATGALDRLFPRRGESRAREARLEAALRKRIARPSDRAARLAARIVFDAGDDGGAWTISFRRGEISLTRGRSRRATSTLTGELGTLVDVLEGRLQGVDAFLSGRLLVRGNLALPLELDDLLHPMERDPRSPRCHRVTALGVEGFYLEAGSPDAPPLVLLHGLGATSASFLPTLWDLSREYRVIAVDLPGFGESGKPVRPLHAEYFAEWVVAFLDAVGIKRAHIAGNSMGGRVALEVGLRNPERVDRLVLITPSLAWLRYRVAVHLVRWLRPEIAVVPLPVLHAAVVASIKTMFAHPSRVPEAAFHGAADEFLRVFRTPRGRIAFFHAAREIYLEDPHGLRGFWQRLKTLSRPALFFFGDEDRLVPHGFLRHVRRALPNAEIELFEGCGHVPQFELPDLTHARMRAFLKRAT
jgi:pimeloyl-ACP methyl ester carboxylesterase/putative sterol carrier protein